MFLEYAYGFGAGSNDLGLVTHAGADGNLYLTGVFEGTVDFDPSVATSTLSSTSFTDVFLAKYDQAGNYLWAFSLTGSTVFFKALHVDINGNVYATGDFNGTVDFDPSSAVNNLYSVNDDIFLAKYDPFGNYVWAIKISGGSDAGLALAADRDGNILVTGHFSGTADFDPGSAVSNLSSAGSTDIFLAKYDISGNYIWAKRIGGTGFELGNSLLVDIAGNIYLYGNFSGTADFDPSASTVSLTSSGSQDIFIALYDSAGSYLWANRLGGSDVENAESLGRDANGNIFITGLFRGTADFDPSAASNTETSAGGNDIFIARYDPSGNYLSSMSIGGLNNEYGGFSVTDSLGNVSISGFFTGTVDFDPGIAVANLSSAGLEDIYVCRYDSSFSYIGGFRVGDSSSDKSESITMDGQGNLYLTGSFRNSPDFDPGAASSNLTSAGSDDIFLAKYGPTDGTGMGVDFSNDNFTLYPNPAGDRITIHFRSDAPYDLQIEVYDVVGKLAQNIPLRGIQIGENTKDIDISELDEGIYLMRIVHKDKILNAKLIKFFKGQ